MELTHLNTGELIAKCRENDQAAQLEIYHRYYKAMYNTAFRIVKDTTEAEDQMQEAFLTAFTKLSSLHNNDLFGSWLKRIVINKSLTALQKFKDQQEIALTLVAHKIPESWDESEDNDMNTVKAEEVLDALSSLKERYSTSLSLHLVEGYDYEEISQIMNISYANCRTLISRAKESLRKKLIQL